MLENNKHIAPNQSIMLKSKKTYIVFRKDLDGVSSIHSPDHSHHKPYQELNRIMINGNRTYICNSCKTMRLSNGYRQGCDVTYESVAGQVEDLEEEGGQSEEEGGQSEEKDVGESQTPVSTDSSVFATDNVSRLAGINFNDQV
jgi:hypothetical protein